MQQSRGQKLLYLVIFIVLVGFLAFAIVSSRDTTKTSGTAKAPGKMKSAESANGSGESGLSVQPSDSTTELVSTGPKETVAVFVVAVAASTYIAHAYQRRRV